MINNWNEQQDSILIASIQWDSSWPEFAREERHDLILYLEERFGIHHTVFDDYLLLKKNKCWWLLRRSDFLRNASSLKVWMTGLKAFQDVGRYIKPTTRMIQVFGHHATKTVMDINADDLKKLAEGNHIFTDMKIDNGYIILSLKGNALGLGLFIDGMVSSQMPRRDLISFIE